MEREEKMIKLHNGLYRKQIIEAGGHSMFKTLRGDVFYGRNLICPLCKEKMELYNIMTGIEGLYEPEQPAVTDDHETVGGYSFHSSTSYKLLTLTVKCPVCTSELKIPAEWVSTAWEEKRWED